MVYVMREAYSRMWHYVDIADKEVGWLGTVEKTPSGDFLITEVFLIKQEVSPVNTDLSEEGIAELAQELFDTRTDGFELVNAIRFWGHSHVRMDTSPSGQDNLQMKQFRENGCDWFVRGILNKLGRMEFTVFLFDAGVHITDVPWAIYEPINDHLRAGIEAEFAAKVTEQVWAPKSGTHINWAGYGGQSHSFPDGFGLDGEDVMLVGDPDFPGRYFAEEMGGER